VHKLKNADRSGLLLPRSPSDRDHEIGFPRSQFDGESERGHHHVAFIEFTPSRLSGCSRLQVASSRSLKPQNDYGTKDLASIPERTYGVQQWESACRLDGGTDICTKLNKACTFRKVKWVVHGNSLRLGSLGI